MNTTFGPQPKDPEVASSLNPLGDQQSPNTESVCMKDPYRDEDPFHGQSFSDGLPKCFHVRPHSPDGNLQKGCTVKYSLKRYDLFNGDRIAKEWADQYGLEEIGSGCRMVGDPIRDIQFEPLHLLPLELDPKRILPRLYTLEIDGRYVSVRFQTMRIPDGDVQAVFSFLTKWAESNNLVFASSYHRTPSPDTPIKDCYSSIMFRPKGDIGGKIELLVTPGHDDPNRMDAEVEDAPFPPPLPSATPSTPLDDTPFPTEDFVTDDSPFS